MRPGPKGDKLYVIQVVEAGERILDYTKDVSQERFLRDTLIQDAVVRNFTIMGEAAKRVSAELRAERLDVPWTALAGFRDVLVHRYDEIVPSEVWHAVKEKLPEALESIKKVARERGWS